MTRYFNWTATGLRETPRDITGVGQYVMAHDFDEAVSVIKECENALADYIPQLERNGSMLNYGKRVLEAARSFIEKAKQK